MHKTLDWVRDVLNDKAAKCWSSSAVFWEKLKPGHASSWSVATHGTWRHGAGAMTPLGTRAPNEDSLRFHNHRKRLLVLSHLLKATINDKLVLTNIDYVNVKLALEGPPSSRTFVWSSTRHLVTCSDVRMRGPSSASVPHQISIFRCFPEHSFCLCGASQ